MVLFLCFVFFLLFLVTFHSRAVIIICVQDACFGPLETTTAFILKGLSSSASPQQTGFLKIVDKNFRFWSLLSLTFFTGLSCEIGSSFSPVSSPRGNKPIMMVGSNKENIWLSVCLGQIASAYISIFPKPLWSCQEHGPAKGKTEREAARMQNARQARQGDTAGSMAEGT